MFTHRKEKHEMLRNAVLNSALPMLLKTMNALCF